MRLTSALEKKLPPSDFSLKRKKRIYLSTFRDRFAFRVSSETFKGFAQTQQRKRIEASAGLAPPLEPKVRGLSESMVEPESPETQPLKSFALKVSRSTFEVRVKTATLLKIRTRR